MDETSAEGASALTDRSLAVALITSTRYLAGRDLDVVANLQGSLEHARSSSLPEADVAVLELLIGAIGSY